MYCTYYFNKNIKKQIICKCKTGTYGIHCEKFLCSSRCKISNCTAPDVCKECIAGFSGVKCQNPVCIDENYCIGAGMVFLKSECEMVSGKRTCKCPSTIEGQYCNLACTNKCINGYCRITNVL